MRYLVYAYASIWLIHCGYLLSLAFRQRRVSDELAALRKLLEKR